MLTLKKIAGGAVIASTALLAALSAQAAIPIQHWTLANGAKVYLAATDALPIVDVQIDVDAGSRRDPAAQAGLASASAGMVEKGVRASDAGPALDENALGEAWADLGASFGAGAGAERTSFSLRSLSDPALLDRAVALAAREIGEPSFPADVWQREREQINAALKEANTKPGTVSARTFSQAVYGTHPYGQETTEATLAKIDVETMRTRYAQLILPCRAKVSIVGAVTRAQADAIATRLLARLPAQDGRCEPLPAVPPIAVLTAPKEERIPFASAQAHVVIGQPGYLRTDPDHFALTIGNYILGGGGFVSRLMNEVREKRGLVYGISSGFAPGLHAGAFRVGFQTRPDQADAAVQVSRQVLARFVAEGPTEAELKAAKDNLIGGFPLLLDSNRKLLGNVSNIAWNDLPLDYLDTWTARMNAVTVADIKAAFARKLQPDRMVTVVVGAKP
ncbi:M16 family metallopeptidase [Variovorax arabinosiphilus]|uniref:M16 family metallopeptidase n=1 Tax=Variovorax arabinosiphilus TaxID=3053498 RepID=UPI0025762C80|nr:MULTISPECIES: pitrilysin family protein [unclassified Variovorax]MDM0120697.1 pitrilysin family protein [Variovorax sp. J2L1-78]MDM0127391.1 pitrilysin family protein [Variovorax sp. J2L1-63]MDM0231090.1 pitrilysin family protein [Variovorax sp. J2R1-6]